MEQLVQRAEGEGRMLTAEESSRFEVLNAEVRTAEASATVAGFRQLQPRVAQSAPLGGPTASWTVPGTPGATSSTGPFPSPEMAAFRKYMQSGQFTNALTSTAAEGGVTIPTVLSNVIQEVWLKYNPMRSLVNVVTTPSGAYQHIVAKTGAVAAWATETGTRSDTTSPSFANIVPPGGEMYAHLPITSFLLDDTAYNLDAFIGGQAGKAFGILEDAGIWSGTGANGQIKGLSQYTYAFTADASRTWGQVEKIKSASSATFDADDLIALLFTLATPYHSNATWVMAPATAAYVRTLKDAATGRYVWEPGGAAPSNPPTLFGRPVVLDTNVPAMAADSLSVYIADWEAAYILVDAGQPRYIRDPYTVKGSVIHYIAARRLGALVDSNAIKVLQLSA
jgi:HK97 family phage major capsid protein